MILLREVQQETITHPRVIIVAAEKKESPAKHLKSNLLTHPQILTQVEEEADLLKEKDQEAGHGMIVVAKITIKAATDVILEAGQEAETENVEAEATSAGDPHLATPLTHLHPPKEAATDITKRASVIEAAQRIARRRAGSPLRKKRSERCKPV